MSTILVNLCEVLVAILWWYSIEELQSFSPNSCFQTSSHPCRLLILCFSPESTPGVSMRVNLKQKELHCVKHSWLEAKQVDLVRANTYCYKLMKLKALETHAFCKRGKNASAKQMPVACFSFQVSFNGTSCHWNQTWRS